MTYIQDTAGLLARFKSISKPALLTVTIIVCSVFMPVNAHAQRVNPMAFELTPSGSDSTAVLRVENTSQTKMTIELSASKISIDENGDEERLPAEDDFLIFPPQAFLDAGKVQSVRVKYIGDPAITQSEAYRIKVSQVPIDITGEGQSAIGLVVNFHTLATVAPKNAKIDLVVTSIRPNASGAWDMVIENKGSKMARLSRTNWNVSDGTTSKSFSSQEVADMTDKNLVMPGGKMALSIPALEGINPATAQIKINVPS